MLETAELGHAIGKADFERAEPALREALVQAQYQLLAGRHKAVVVLLSGVAAGGRGETAKQLAEWMDPRHLRVQAFGPRTPEELARSTTAAWTPGCTRSASTSACSRTRTCCC
jgi:polyphosphate kinase 2 (PPK2 family)